MPDLNRDEIDNLWFQSIKESKDPRWRYLFAELVISKHKPGDRMKVEVCVEGMNTFVRADLKDTLKSLQEDLKRRKAGGNLAIFHTDSRQDIDELKRHVDAFKLVLRYYGEA